MPTHISAPEHCGLSALCRSLGTRCDARCDDALSSPTDFSVRMTPGSHRRWAAVRNFQIESKALPSPHLKESHASVETRESLYASSRREILHI
jgi:hypothetical protein